VAASPAIVLAACAGFVGVVLVQSLRGRLASGFAPS
jgi:hypothetical protein